MNMVREAVSSLLAAGKIQVPAVPGFSRENWLTDPSSTLQKILMRAKKGKTDKLCTHVHAYTSLKLLCQFYLS